MAESRSSPPPAGARRRTAADPFVRAVRRFLDDHGASLAGRRVVALCSGGVDSSVLLDVVMRLPRGARPAAVRVLWFDHALRDVAADRAAVREAAARWELELVERRWEGALGPHAGGLQAAARDWRRAEAARVARASGSDVVVSGHTADDQLESLLLGITGSGGLASASGMAVACELAPAVQLVRPLLASSRDDVAAYARRAALRWVEDPTNAHARFRRNELRHTVVEPLLASHPGAAANLARTQRQLRDADEAMTALARAVLGGAPPGAPLRLAAVEPLPASARRVVVAHWLRTAPLGRALTSRAVEAVIGLIDAAPGARVQLEGACVRRDRYDLHFWRAEGCADAPKEPSA